MKYTMFTTLLLSTFLSVAQAGDDTQQLPKLELQAHTVRNMTVCYDGRDLKMVESEQRVEIDDRDPFCEAHGFSSNPIRYDHQIKIIRLPENQQPHNLKLQAHTVRHMAVCFKGVELMMVESKQQVTSDDRASFCAEHGFRPNPVSYDQIKIIRLPETQRID